MLSVSLYTLGCKLNQVESEALADAFRQVGFSLSALDETADATAAPPDIFIINTCTVTSRSDQKARRVIRKALRENPAAAVIVTGCYAALDREKIETIEDGIPPGNRLFVCADKAALLELPSWLASALAGEGAGQSTAGTAELISRWTASREKESGAGFDTARFAPRQFSFHTRSFIKIQDGCDNHCTYCRIRLARGKSRSVDARSVLAELQALEEAGYWEAVLTGVNIMQYRQDDLGGPGNLLAFLLANTKTIGLRLSSLDPRGINDEFAEIASHPRIRPHFHLSVQSGSGEVLAKMGRAYSGRLVEQAVTRLRAAKDKPFVACDIITGFPGEGKAEFAQTLALCQKLDFAWIHAFPYSPRPGTEAFAFPRTAGEAEAAERVDTLTTLARRGRQAYARLWTGSERETLVESGSGKDDEDSGLPRGYCRGLTDNYLRALIRYSGASRPAPGTILKCRIETLDKPGYDVLAESRLLNASAQLSLQLTAVKNTKM